LRTAAAAAGKPTACVRYGIVREAFSKRAKMSNIPKETGMHAELETWQAQAL
jgi:hypothetical protein